MSLITAGIHSLNTNLGTNMTSVLCGTDNSLRKQDHDNIYGLQLQI
jgi:hypothetical protein